MSFEALRPLRVPGTAGVILLLLLFLSRSDAAENHPPAAGRAPSLVLVDQYPTPVITVAAPDAGPNKYGFAGGSVVKESDLYHLVTTELTGDPRFVKTRLAHWISKDRVHWNRASTLYESSGEFSGQDPRAALSEPMFAYDGETQTWNLFYVASRAGPDTKTKSPTNYEGTLWRSVSRDKGSDTIDGSYEDMGIILHPDPGSQPGEGPAGIGSFFPYQVGDHWLGFYVSADQGQPNFKPSLTELAEAPRLAGPWQRCSETNAANFHPRSVGHPVVTKLADGSYLTLFANGHANALGWAWSPDGVKWQAGKELSLRSKGKSVWATGVRIPLGLIPEGDDRYTLFYTADMRLSASRNVGAVGLLTLKCEPQKPVK